MPEHTPQSPVQQGVDAGFARAALFNVAPPSQQELVDSIARVTEGQDVGPQSLKMFSEVVTLANVGRRANGHQALRDEDVRLTFSFWEWLFDGLVRR